MTLQELVRLLRTHDLVESAPDADAEVTSLAVDSREVRPGALFIALRGTAVDGHRFLPQAVKAGSSAVLVERAMECGVPVVVVRDSKRAAQLLAEAWFDYPARELSLIGITGTNGKTTTTALVRHLLNAASDAGSIGTLGAFDGRGNSVESSAGSLTTPGPLDLQATFRALRSVGVRSVATETSSHALDQGRLEGVTFAAGIFTNLTRDHLDYHGTMEQYVAAKLRLADLVAPDGLLVANIDDGAWRPLMQDRRLISWGTGAGADVHVRDVVCLAAGSRFVIDGRFGSREASLPFAGDFNVSNAAAAAATALGLGLTLDHVVERLASAPQVPGRMERIVDAPFQVLRDYSHTPDALERALATLRPITTGQVIVLFGCGGERDKGKRPMMGRIAVAGADRVIVTSDNPRSEDPERIIDDIVTGMPNGSFERMSDRRKAIAFALKEAAPGDAVLLAGKGHEDYQVIGTEYFPFDERQIVLELLRP